MKPDPILNTRRQPDKFTTRNEKQTMSSSTISKSITITAPKDRVWRALADFGSISTWNPNVSASKLTSPQPGGLGATRQCRLAPMGIIDERIVQWDEERALGIEVYEMQKMPGMREATAAFNLSDEHVDGKQTTVVLTMGYEVGLGVLGSTMNALGMRRQFSNAATGLLAGLKHHVETGASVTGKTKLPTEAVLAVG